MSRRFNADHVLTLRGPAHTPQSEATDMHAGFAAAGGGVINRDAERSRAHIGWLRETIARQGPEAVATALASLQNGRLSSVPDEAQDEDLQAGFDAARSR